jgi:nucleotide-binding universal stress UspA family protein
MKTILLAIDFSDGSPHVIGEALTMSQAFGAKLVILYVVQPPVIAHVEVLAQTTANFVMLATEAAETQLAALKNKISREDIAVETKQRVGMPGPCIVEMATALGADYILLGSHGHGALYDLIVGSTTSYVLNNARSTVVVVPNRSPQKALENARANPSLPLAL